MLLKIADKRIVVVSFIDNFIDKFIFILAVFFIFRLAALIIQTTPPYDISRQALWLAAC